MTFQEFELPRLCLQPLHLFQEDFCSNANPVQQCREVPSIFLPFLLPDLELYKQDIR